MISGSATRFWRRWAIGGEVVGLGVHEQQGELVPAEPRGGVGGADLVAEPARDDPEQLVAVQVAQGVVDQLEPVQVEEHHGAARLGRAASGASPTSRRSRKSRRLGRPVTWSYRAASRSCSSSARRWCMSRDRAHGRQTGAVPSAVPTAVTGPSAGRRGAGRGTRCAPARRAGTAPARTPRRRPPGRRRAPRTGRRAPGSRRAQREQGAGRSLSPGVARGQVPLPQPVVGGSGGVGVALLAVAEGRWRLLRVQRGAEQRGPVVVGLAGDREVGLALDRQEAPVSVRVRTGRTTQTRAPSRSARLASSRGGKSARASRCRPGRPASSCAVQARPPAGARRPGRRPTAQHTEGGRGRTSQAQLARVRAGAQQRGVDAAWASIARPNAAPRPPRRPASTRRATVSSASARTSLSPGADDVVSRPQHGPIA